MFSIPPVPYSLPDHSMEVLVLQMTCQTHIGISWQPHCLLPHIQAVGSVAPCFDLPLSQRAVSSPSLLLTKCGRSKSLQHSFIIQQNTNFSSVHGTDISLHYCGVLPAVKTSHSLVCQYKSALYTKCEDCNHSAVSVLVSIIKQ